MAALGIQPPKWIYDSGGGSEHVILFDYVFDIELKPKHYYIENESEIDLERDFYRKGTHYTLDFKINLYKYSTVLSEIKAKQDEIISYVGLKGTLWQHRDASQFKKSGGSDALFVLKEVLPFNLDNITFKDALYIKFESCSPVDLSQSSSPSLQLANIVMSNSY